MALATCLGEGTESADWAGITCRTCRLGCGGAGEAGGSSFARDHIRVVGTIT